MKASRPPLLLILVIIGFIGCFFVNIRILWFLVESTNAPNPVRWYPAYLSLSTLYVIVSLFGLAMMKRWAVIAYTFYFITHQAVHLIMGNWDPIVLILPGVITLTGWFYYRRMT